jgi:hypothetical protein
MLPFINPYLFPNSGVCAHRAEARIGSCTIIGLRDFDGRDAAFFILN